MSAIPAFTVARHRLPWPRLLCVVLCCLLLEAEWPACAQQVGSIEGPAAGTISGTVVDQDGNFLLAARVSLTRPGQTEEKTQESDGAGHFVFTAVPPGPYQLTVTGEGFATQQIPGVLHPGEALEVPLISLSIAAATTEVRVSVTNYELAEEQVKIQEKQRVLGVIPNFYVSYQKDALPL